MKCFALSLLNYYVDVDSLRLMISVNINASFNLDYIKIGWI
jgi:hypothetical protein